MISFGDEYDTWAVYSGLFLLPFFSTFHIWCFLLINVLNISIYIIKSPINIYWRLFVLELSMISLLLSIYIIKSPVNIYWRLIVLELSDNIVVVVITIKSPPTVWWIIIVLVLSMVVIIK